MPNELSNYDYCTETVKLKQTIETSFLSLGERLSKIRDERMFVGQFETFEGFLEEAKISPATASKLINIYQRFHIEWHIKAQDLVDAGGWSVVATLLPVCKTKDDAKTWLETAALKSRGDLEKDIKEAKSGIDMGSCLCDTNYYIIKVCRNCGKRIPIYEDNFTKEEVRSLR